jgi:hypothetical protein
MFSKRERENNKSPYIQRDNFQRLIYLIGIRVVIRMKIYMTLVLLCVPENVEDCTTNLAYCPIFFRAANCKYLDS